MAADSPCLRSRCAAIKHRSHSQCATGRFRNSVRSDSFWWVQRVTRKSDGASHRTGAQIPRGGKRKRGQAPNAGPTSDEARGLGVEPNGAGGRRGKVRARGQRNQKTKTGPDRREEEGTHNNASTPAQLRKRFSPRLAHRRQTTAATSSVGGRVSLPPSFLVGREKGGGGGEERRRPRQNRGGGRKGGRGGLTPKADWQLSPRQLGIAGRRPREKRGVDAAPPRGPLAASGERTRDNTPPGARTK